MGIVLHTVFKQLNGAPPCVVVLTDTYLINYLCALVAVNKIVKNEFQIVLICCFQSCLFNTIGILIKSPCQHRS